MYKRLEDVLIYTASIQPSTKKPTNNITIPIQATSPKPHHEHVQPKNHHPPLPPPPPPPPPHHSPIQCPRPPSHHPQQSHHRTTEYEPTPKRHLPIFRQHNHQQRLASTKQLYRPPPLSRHAILHLRPRLHALLQLGYPYPQRPQHGQQAAARVSDEGIILERTLCCGLLRNLFLLGWGCLHRICQTVMELRQ